jgi:hypothetical protein
MKNTIIISKKTVINRLVLLLLLITTSSCSKEFLDEPKNTSGVTENVVFNSRETVQSFISGMYANYKGQYRDPDTGGLYSLFLTTATKGTNLIQVSFPYAFDYDHENREPNFRRTSFTWDFNYQTINNANILIQGVAESNLGESDKKEFVAIGKAIRAFHYFQLALDFCPNYNNDRTIARLPIYTERATLETAKGNPPSPLSDVYDLILADLRAAIPDIPDSRLGKSYINKAVANGMLAQVLSVTQDSWLEMSAAARNAYGGNAASAVISSNWGNGFDDMQDQEWLWGHFQNGTTETNFFWGHPAAVFDHLTLSWQATYIDPDFVGLFSNSDIRNTFFDFYGVSDSQPWREFVSRKFSFTFGSDIPTMRKSEMVLLDAEAQYQMGNEMDAHDLLFALQKNRDPNAVKSTNTGQDLLDEILLERRKELYGEIGTEWFDAKRYNLPIVRGNKHLNPLTVPVDSNLFFLKIPQDEIDANEFIDSSINAE